MFSRNAAFAAAAVLVTAGAVVPAATAQDSGSSMPGSSQGTSTTSTASAGSGSAGNLDSGSLKGVVPTTDAGMECDLPGLGGSIAKFYPLLGITEIPSIVVTLATSALDAFPNLLEVVGLDSQLGQTGSLNGPLCSTVLGGHMTSTATATTTTAAPVTVTVSVSNGTTTTIMPSTTAATTTTTTPVTSKVPTAGSLGGIDSGSLGTIAGS